MTSECGKYQQISAINPCLFSPQESQERGMHHMIYASVEITEKAEGEEQNVAFYWDVVSPTAISLTAGVSS